MSDFVLVLLSYFASFGFFAFIGRIAKVFASRKNDEIYVYFDKEKTLSGKWDVLIASDDADKILESLSDKYGRIYILRGADRWTRKEENGSKEALKK